MDQLFLQLAQSVTGNVVIIVLLNLAAAVIGFVIAWYYAKSVYAPVIKGLEEGNQKLNSEITRLNSQISGLRIKEEELSTKIAGMEASFEKKVAELHKLKEPAHKSTPLGKYAVSASRGGETYFNLKATNGQVILTSKMFKTTEECQLGIETVRAVCTDDSMFERKIATSGKPYFNLITADGRMLGKSEIYESDANMEKGIASVKKNGVTTTIVQE
jgi:uncharacterized protein